MVGEVVVIEVLSTSVGGFLVIALRRLSQNDLYVNFSGSLRGFSVPF